MYNIAKDGSCWPPLFACFFLVSLFVGSLYIWHSKHDRNHPSTIKKRFCSVFVVIIISPFIVKFFITNSHFKKFSILELLGFKLPGLVPATVIPLFLTMVLFLGSLCMQDVRQIQSAFISVDFWLSNITSLIWLRNIIVGPLAEEFTFRACMVPLLLQCFSPVTVIFVCSLFFGLAHTHHFWERYKAGDPIKILFLRALVQFSYTAVFGAYSAYVFIQTGHLIASFIVHAFCNMVAFPDFGGVLSYENPKKIILILMYISGVVLWYILLPYLLNHMWYSNYVYYDDDNYDMKP